MAGAYTFIRPTDKCRKQDVAVNVAQAVAVRKISRESDERRVRDPFAVLLPILKVRNEIELCLAFAFSEKGCIT